MDNLIVDIDLNKKRYQTFQ